MSQALRPYLQCKITTLHKHSQAPTNIEEHNGTNKWSHQWPSSIEACGPWTTQPDSFWCGFDSFWRGLKQCDVAIVWSGWDRLKCFDKACHSSKRQLLR
jgi:hypothetical protein